MSVSQRVRISFLSLSAFITPRDVLNPQVLQSRSAAVELKIHHFTLWMNEWISEGMNEKKASEWMNGWGGEGCSVMRYILGPANPFLFFLPHPLPSDWLRGFNAAGRYCSHVGVTPLPPHHNLCSLWMKVGKIEWRNGLHVSEFCVLTHCCAQVGISVLFWLF